MLFHIERYYWEVFVFDWSRVQADDVFGYPVVHFFLVVAEKIK
jgi:hypothetical protein